MNCLLCGIIGFIAGITAIAIGIYVYAYLFNKDIMDTYNRGKNMPKEDDYGEGQDT